MVRASIMNEPDGYLWTVSSVGYTPANYLYLTSASGIT